MSKDRIAEVAACPEEKEATQSSTTWTAAQASISPNQESEIIADMGEPTATKANRTPPPKPAQRLTGVNVNKRMQHVMQTIVFTVLCWLCPTV